MPARPAPAPAMKPRREAADNLGVRIDVVMLSSRYYRRFDALLPALYQVAAVHGIIAGNRPREAAHGCPHHAALHRHAQGPEDPEPRQDAARRAPRRRDRPWQPPPAEAQAHRRGGRLRLDPGAARWSLAARCPP